MIKWRKSFTLIEIVIAITVLAMGIFSVIALAGKSYGAISLQKNKLIAINLTREGMEIVRSVRDENWLTETGCNGEAPGFPGSCDGKSGRPHYRSQEDDGSCDWRCGKAPGYRLNQDLRDIDYTGDAVTGAGPFDDCTDTAQSVALERDANDFYVHNGVDSTPFRRLIIINRVSDLNGDGNSDNDLSVRVIVCWQERGGRWHETSIEDHLYNWAH